jgi:hypothetical protein
VTLPLPPAPENVRLVVEGVGEVPVECRYAGCDDTGIHVWVTTAVTGIPHRSAITALKADGLPPRTRVELLVRPEDG